MTRLARIFAFLIGGLTLLYQVGEVLSGRLFNQFLVADLVLGILMIAAAGVPNRFNSVLAMLVAYAYACGVFMVATTGGLLISRYDFGAFTTTVGLFPCSIFTVLLSRWLVQKVSKPA
jgi:hypothetical protein